MCVLKTFRMDKTRINNILFILIEIILMFRLLCFNFFLIFAFVVVAVVVLFSNCQWVYKWISFFWFLSFFSIFGYSSRVSSSIRFHNLFFFLLSVPLLFSTVFCSFSCCFSCQSWTEFNCGLYVMCSMFYMVFVTDSTLKWILFNILAKKENL